MCIFSQLIDELNSKTFPKLMNGDRVHRLRFKEPTAAVLCSGESLEIKISEFVVTRAGKIQASFDNSGFDWCATINQDFQGKVHQRTQERNQYEIVIPDTADIEEFKNNINKVIAQYLQTRTIPAMKAGIEMAEKVCEVGYI